VPKKPSGPPPTASRGPRPGPPPRGQGRKEDLPRRLIAGNRRARHDYRIEKTVEAGLVLVGSEVKSLRTNGATLAEAFARLEDGELWLERMHVPPLPQASYQNHDPTRRRKCLLHRRELEKLAVLLEQGGRTLVPLSLYFLGHRIKIELGLGLSRQKGDRREAEKAKEGRRDARSAEGRRAKRT
jgi:SsrA-binding protein